MRENRLYGSVGGWGLNRPPPTQSIARTAAQENRSTIGPQTRAQRGVNAEHQPLDFARPSTLIAPGPFAIKNNMVPMSDRFFMN